MADSTTTPTRLVGVEDLGERQVTVVETLHGTLAASRSRFPTAVAICSPRSGRDKLPRMDVSSVHGTLLATTYTPAR
jgi:hypothetical protein